MADPIPMYRWTRVNNTDPVYLELVVQAPAGGRVNYRLQRDAPAVDKPGKGQSIVINLTDLGDPSAFIQSMTITGDPVDGSVAIRVVQGGNIVGAPDAQQVNGGTALKAESWTDGTGWGDAPAPLLIAVAAGGESRLSIKVR